MTSPFDGIRTLLGFLWKWTFCEEWQILGGIVESQDQLAKWAALLFQTREQEDRARLPAKSSLSRRRRTSAIRRFLAAATVESGVELPRRNQAPGTSLPLPSVAS